MADSIHAPQPTGPRRQVPDTPAPEKPPEKDYNFDGKNGGMSFEACPDDSFVQNVWRVTTDPAISPAPTDQRLARGLAVSFYTDRCFMVLKERVFFKNATKSFLSVSLTIPPGAYEILHVGNKPDGSYEILLQLSSPTLQIVGENISTSDVKTTTPPDRRLKTNLISWSTRHQLLDAQFLRVRVLNASENRNVAKFSRYVEMILRAAHLPSLANSSRYEHDLQIRALNAEYEIVEKKLADWSLKGEKPGVFTLLSAGSDREQPAGTIKGHLNWDIEDFALVTVTTVEEEPIFHASKAIKYKGNSSWVAQIQHWSDGPGRTRQFRDVKILNDVNGHLRHQMASQIGREFVVTVIAIEDDQMMPKLRQSMGNFLQGAQVSRSNAGLDSWPTELNRRGLTKLDTPRLFVDHPRHHPQTWKCSPFALQPGRTELQYHPSWNRSHGKALKSIHKGRGRVSGCVGPPGCGKTTLMGVLAPQMMLQFVLPHRTIVMTSHTNTAVRQLVEKTSAGLLSAGFNPLELLVHIRTSGSRVEQSKRGNDSKQENADEDPAPRSNIEQFNIYEHCRRLANVLGPQYQQWHDGDAELRIHGGIADRGLREAHDSLERDLFSRIKERSTVFIGTISAVTGSFFVPGEDIHDGQYPVDIVMIDEASQATLPHVLLLVQTLDPEQLFIAGDTKQLAAYCASNDPEIKAIVQNSAIDRVESRGIRLPMLTREFRMAWNLYYATSKMFYDLKVHAADSLFNSPEETAMRALLMQIEVWTGNKRVRLVNTGMIFNILRGQQAKKDGSLSSYNLAEARFVKHLAAALVTAGLPAKKILQLSGYKAQTELMQQNNTRSQGGRCRVKTAEKSQGDDEGVVIVSTVVSGPPYSVGFMGDGRRANVITSRQKEALFLVCKYDLLTANEMQLQRGGVAYSQRPGYLLWGEWLGYFGHAQREAMGQLGIRGQFKVDINTDKPQFWVNGVEVVPTDEIVYVDAAAPPPPTGNYAAAASSLREPPPPLSPPGPPRAPTPIFPPAASPSPPSPKMGDLDISSLPAPEEEEPPVASATIVSLPPPPPAPTPPPVSAFLPAPTEVERSVTFQQLMEALPPRAQNQLNVVADNFKEMIIDTTLGEEDMVMAVREGFRRRRAEEATYAARRG